MSNNKTSNIFFMVCIGVGVLIDLTSKVKLLTFPYLKKASTLERAFAFKIQDTGLKLEQGLVYLSFGCVFKKKAISFYKMALRNNNHYYELLVSGNCNPDHLVDCGDMGTCGLFYCNGSIFFFTCIRSNLTRRLIVSSTGIFIYLCTGIN